MNSIHLIDGPSGNSYFCFPESPGILRERIGLEENETNQFHEGPNIKRFGLHSKSHHAFANGYSVY